MGAPYSRHDARPLTAARVFASRKCTLGTSRNGHDSDENSRRTPRRQIVVPRAPSNQPPPKKKGTTGAAPCGRRGSNVKLCRGRRHSDPCPGSLCLPARTDGRGGQYPPEGMRRAPGRPNHDSRLVRELARRPAGSAEKVDKPTVTGAGIRARAAHAGFGRRPTEQCAQKRQTRIGSAMHPSSVRGVYRFRAGNRS